LEVTGPGGTSNQGENDGVVVAVSSVMTGALRACSHRHTHGRRSPQRAEDGDTELSLCRCVRRAGHIDLRMHEGRIGHAKCIWICS
jgi:hypothetical protein